MSYNKDYMSFKLFQYHHMSFNMRQHINTRVILRCGGPKEDCRHWDE